MIYANSSGVLTGHDFPADTVLQLTSSDVALSLPDTTTTDDSGHLSVAYHAGPRLSPYSVD